MRSCVRRSGRGASGTALAAPGFQQGRNVFGLDAYDLVVLPDHCVLAEAMFPFEGFLDGFAKEVEYALVIGG